MAGPRGVTDDDRVIDSAEVDNEGQGLFQLMKHSSIGMYVLRTRRNGRQLGCFEFLTTYDEAK